MGATSSSEAAHQLPWSSFVGDEEDKTPRRRVLLYGDSLTAGFYAGGLRFSPYGNALESTLGSFGLPCEVVINGLSGHRASQMVAELDSSECTDICGKSGKGLRHMLEHDRPYDLVVIMTGTNDYGKSQLKEIFSAVRELHTVCHQRGIPTVCLAAPCYTQSLRIGLSQMLREWASQTEQVLAFIDPEEEVIPRREAAYWEQDKVHFTPLGSQTLGKYLGTSVVEMMQSRRRRKKLKATPAVAKTAPTILSTTMSTPALVTPRQGTILQATPRQGSPPQCTVPQATPRQATPRQPHVVGSTQVIHGIQLQATPPGNCRQQHKIFAAQPFTAVRAGPALAARAGA